MTRARTHAAVLLATLAIAAAAHAQEVVPPSAPIDFSLEETSGQTRTMREVRGRVVVIFYEDREHTDLNREFKMTLHQFITDNQLRDQTTTYAVANVSSISGGVMRDMARTAIRAIASQYGIQLLLDWDHTLEAAPLSMRDGAANLALVDRAGRVRWRHTGAIGEPERRSFFRAFRQLLREPTPTP
ncbi:MAG: hypothetical protein M3Y87_11635 [Myxococcota bacterium]|nr:hypothetical protein [Myxococcota bacterium]